jgi:putative transposase
MLIGSKHRLELNNKQKTLAFQHAGVSRHAWNWGVQLCKEASEKREKLPSGIDLHKLLVKNVKTENKWYYEVSKCSPQQALRDLHGSWSRYFTNLKKGEVEKKKQAYIRERKRKGLELDKSKLFDLCKPKFKKKGVNDSFYLENVNAGGIRIVKNKIKVPIFGWIKMSETFEEDFNVKNVTISRVADEWFISFKREVNEKQFIIPDIEKKPTVGVDLGIKTLAKISNGQEFSNVKAFKRFKRKLKIAQRVVSKRFNKNNKKQSNNYKKAKNKVAKIHQRITNIRKDATHKLTTYLAKNHSVVKIEDLNVKGMMKNHKLANAISDGGFYEFRRQLEYKTKWYGSKLFVIDRFFPSSKTCSCCGNVKDKLKLSKRTYECENCGLSIDRDLNAAININNFAVS